MQIWKHEQLHTCPIGSLETLSCTQDMEILSNWEVHRDMCFAFSQKYISAVVMRPNTLDEPPVPSLCGLFKMDITDIQFFSISFMTKICRVCIESLKFPPNSILKMTTLCCNCWSYALGENIPSGSSVP